MQWGGLVTATLIGVDSGRIRQRRPPEPWVLEMHQGVGFGRQRGETNWKQRGNTHDCGGDSIAAQIPNSVHRTIRCEILALFINKSFRRGTGFYSMGDFFSSYC